MGTIVESLITKLGFAGDNNVLRKTNELLRLLELKSSNKSLQISEYAKIVICIDLACNMLGLMCDKEDALKVSCLRKTIYMNQKRLIEKMLDIGRVLDINDICIQLNLNEVKKKAEELLESYGRAMLARNTEIDRTHPQYAAMAVYIAAKFHKKKISKPKLMSYSNLRPTQWQQLEQSWEQVMASSNSQQKLEKLQKAEDENLPGKECITAVNGIKSVKNANTIEEYATWKARMLAEARLKLLRLAEKQNPRE